MVDITKLVGANIEGLEDKIIGYLTIFSISDTARIRVEYMQNLLAKHGYEKLLEIPTPQKAFKRATAKLKQIKETGEVKIGKSNVKVEIIYDTVQSGKIEYLIRKFKIVSGKKTGIVDTERLAKLYLSEKNDIAVEPITRHIYSQKKVLGDEEIKKLYDYLKEKYEKELQTYDGIKLRHFIREKVLRERCNAIPFVSHGGSWFVLNTEENVKHISNLREIIDNINKQNSSWKKITMIILPLFDGEDVRRKIGEDLEREITARYKKLLSSILQKLMYAKSGEDIERTLESLLNNEEQLKKMLKEYVDVIKSSIKLELKGIDEMKNTMMDVIRDKGLEIDKSKFELLISAIGNYKEDELEVKTATEEKEEKLKLFNSAKLEMLYKEVTQGGGE